LNPSMVLMWIKVYDSWTMCYNDIYGRFEDVDNFV